MRALGSWAAVVGCVVACGGGSSATGAPIDAGPVDSGANAFVGSWSCTGTTTVSGESGSGSASSLDVVTANADGTITDSIGAAGSTGGALCSVKLTVSGTTATVESGQTCAILEDGFLGSSLTSGTAVLSGNTLTVSCTFAATQIVTEGDGGSATATITYAATCTK